MNKCLIFAFWVPHNMEKLADYYFNLIEKHFNNEDVYIGINCGTEKKLINEIKIKYPNSIEVPDKICIGSDASAYQMGLSLLNKKYDYVVFGHTKGASYGNLNISESYRDYNEKYFWNKLDYMCEKLNQNKEIGMIGTDYIFDHSGSPNYDNMNKICNFPIKKPYSGFYANTFYVIKGEIINSLLAGINKEFFLKNLSEIDSGFNRYFFESHFPKICGMFGYKPSIIFDDEIKIV